MPEYEGKKAFLAVYDPYSHMAYCRTLTDKGYESTKAALLSIFNACNNHPQVLASDQDVVYRKLSKWLAEQGVLLRFKRGRNKSAAAESLIRWVQYKHYVFKLNLNIIHIYYFL